MEAFPACCGIDYNRYENHFRDNLDYEDEEFRSGLNLAYSEKAPVDGREQHRWTNITGTHIWYLQETECQNDWSKEPLEASTHILTPDQLENARDKELNTLCYGTLWSYKVSVIYGFPYHAAVMDYDYENHKVDYFRHPMVPVRWIWEKKLIQLFEEEQSKKDCTAILADLAKGQIALCEPTLLKLGFRLAVEFTNPKHDSRNRLYVFVPNKEVVANV